MKEESTKKHEEAPKGPPKNIIVCSDGTWNDPEQLDRGSLVPTNVVKFARALALADRPNQKIFYDQGVGTGNFLDRLTGGLTGNGLIKNIFDGYGFIAQHYNPGDKIYLFGFSRGAYTARSLAGLIERFGIDKSLSQRQLAQASTSAAKGKVSQTRTDKVPQELESIKKQYEQYKAAPDDKKHEVIDTYKKKTDCYYPSIEMIGVWDTVGSLGIPFPLPRLRYLTGFNDWLERLFLGKYRFLNVELGTKVKGAYHALSIDENRKAFLPTLWKRNPNAPKNQILRQVWFAGIHSNIGGGYADSGLSDNALLWMVDQAKNKHDLKFNELYLDRRVSADSFYGEIRNERKKWIKKIIFTPGIRSIIELCAEAKIDVIIAESACKRTLSDICKVRYKLSEELMKAVKEPNF